MTPETFLLLTARNPHPSLLLSVDGWVLAANDSAARLLGRAAGSVAGRSLQEIVTSGPADLEDALRTWSAAGVAVSRPLRIRTPGGGDRRFRGEGLRVMTAGRDPVPGILLHCVPLDPAPRRCAGQPAKGKADAAEPTDPGEPTTPTDAAGRTAPTEPTALAAPTHSTAPVQPTVPVTPTGPTDRPAPTASEPDRVVGKMEAMGNLAAGIAHDFNNLLTVMKVEVELSQEHPGLPGMVVESLAATHDAVRQAEALVSGLLAFSRRQLVRVVMLDMSELVAAALQRIRPEITGKGVHLVLEPSSVPLPVAVDRAQMEAVLFALVRNARDAVRDAGHIRVRTRRETVDATFVRDNPGSTEGDFAVLEVADDGVGIPPEVRVRVFEPFFTTKGRGAGRGLGLAQAFGIVKAMSGYLRVESTVGQGATFTVYLPLADAALSRRPRAGPS